MCFLGISYVFLTKPPHCSYFGKLCATFLYNIFSYPFPYFIISIISKQYGVFDVIHFIAVAYHSDDNHHLYHFSSSCTFVS